MMVGGELDGLCRVTRMAEAYYHHRGEGNTWVGVLPGANHMVYADGPIPPFVHLHDLHNESDPA
jgi:hypothetical protein